MSNKCMTTSDYLSTINQTSSSEVLFEVETTGGTKYLGNSVIINSKNVINKTESNEKQ